MVTVDQMVELLRKLSVVYAEQAEMLTDLDSAIGDADHGANMKRGFAKVVEVIDETPPASISDALKTTAMTLIKTVGGASGPLYGNLYLKASMSCKDKTELSAQDLALLFRSGLDAVKALGKAEVGDKTMVDTLVPAVEEMEAHCALGVEEMLRKAVESAERGKHSTIDLVAKKGRASYLGERSAGHQDPGATSSYLLILTASQVLR